ncbi:MAG: alpha-2-macroglobulin family protein [Rhodoferax sp.]|nr:alpha-2-macroglobulin family protein [Rhodoferax sp.]
MESLHEKVRHAAAWLWLALGFVWMPIAGLANLLLGTLDWQAPGWLQWLRERMAPLWSWVYDHAAWAALALVLALAGIWGATHPPQGGWKNWWNWQTFSGAKPDVATVVSPIKVTHINVSGPERTPYEGDAKPRPVVLNFSTSAAPLARVGKEALDVSLSPALAGKWTWVAVNRLEFLPDQDWPIGETYTVTLGAKALAPQVSVDNRTLTFQSPAFALSFKEAIFYQDPVQVNLRKAVFDIGFSHPVNPESFEKRLRLEADGAASGVFAHSADGLKFTVTYDKLRLSASVHSEPLPIPQVSASMVLKIAAGVAAQRGGNATGQEMAKAVAIPGLFSLDVAELTQVIVTADSGEPENVLQITTGMAVHEKEIARATSAWLLPVKNPANDDGNEAYAWSDPEEVTEAVLKQAKKVALTPRPVEREVNETHAFQFATEPGRYLLVRIQKGLKSAGGYQLGATRDEIIRVKRSAPELSIMSKGSLLALSGDKKLPLIVRDLPGVRLEIGRLLPQQLQHLVTQSQGDMTKPEFYAGITPDNLTERFEKKLTYHHKPGKTHFETIDFSEYLKADAMDRRGVFVVSVQGFDPKDGADPQGDMEPDRPSHPEEGGYEGEGEGESQDPSEAVPPAQMRDRRLVIVTDLGVVSKMAVDGTRDVFVQSIANGQPVAGAAVEIWARNGNVLAAQVTDVSGQARLPSMAGLARDKTPVVLVVKKSGDLSFLPLNRADRNLDVSRFDVGGVRLAALPNQIQAYLFSDRGIYRPGDTMNIGIVAKSTNWAQKLADLPVEVEVIDARGLTIRRDTLKLGSSGMAEFSHTTQDVSPTGNYTINLNVARDSGSAKPGASESPAQRLGSVSVKVQEFLPDRMKVSAKLSSEAPEGWIAPKDLKARVNVQNLFGTPAPGRRVDASLTLAPTFPAFRSHPDYSFFDPARAKETFRAELEKGNSDDQGNAEFDLGLQRYAQATYQLHVLVKAFEPEGGRSVAAEATALVSDRPYLIGNKADGDLGYIVRNGVRNVSFIAIDPNAKKKAVGDLRLARIERKVVSVLVKQPNGLYKYESRPKESVLKEEPFAIAANGSNVMLATQTPGNFAFAVRDASGLELSRVNYSVAGTGNVSRSLDRNAELQMALNKKDYEPGEEIEISIRAPYAGAGLITIERDKVFTHKWFMAKDTASVQKITLPKDFEGNGYVSVQFARDLGSNEIYMSPMSYGVVPFATSLDKRTNPMTLQAPALIKPGQTATFKLESRVPSRAVLFAVDEGILQVARYQAPDPLKFFFQKRALEVSTQQTLDLILPEFKKLMQAAPGGDGEGLMGKHLNPFKRRTDPPVAYWSGVVDVNGSREFSYTVPESFNGSLRVMAVTINDDMVAAATQQTVVRGDIVLLPNVPVAITPGDEVEIGVGVANNAKGSGKDAPLKLALTVSPGLEVVGDATQQLKVTERSEVATRFRVRAKPGAQAVLGSASVIFTAQVGAAKARLSTDVSVRPASAFVTLVQTGMFRGEAELKSQADMYPNFQRSEAALSSSPWAFSSGLMQYLEVYPHGCTEQITSQTFPSVLLAAQPGVAEQLQKMSQQGTKAPDARKTLERYLAQVRARQSADGGVAMWPGGQSDLFATTYVVNLLVEARDRKFAVPNDLLQRANVYLQTRIAEATSHDTNWRTQAQAAYLLTRQGVVTTAALTNLHETLRQREALRHDLGAVYLAASFQLLKQEKQAQELLQPALKELLANTDPWKNWYWTYYYDPLVHQSTTVQLLALHFPAQIKVLPMDYWSRIASAIRDNYYQSLSAARMLLAIDAYANAAAKSAAGNVTISAVNAAGVTKALELPRQLALAKLAVPLDSTRLKLKNGGELPLFYAWAESGYERTLPTQEAGKGLEIIHEFLDAKGNVVSEAAVGDELTARVRVRSTTRSDVPQVALVDVLPGGLEPVLSAPSDDDAPDMPIWRRRLGGASSWNIEYADIREDRVVFYGGVASRMTEVTYKVRATNVGEFVVPAAYAEAMYERRIFGRSAAGKFVVKSAGK